MQFPAISIAIAVTIFASQAIGAGQTTALNSVTRTALLTNLAVTGGLILLAYPFRSLMALFITDESVIVMAQQLLHIVLWSILLFSTGTIFSGMIWR